MIIRKIWKSVTGIEIIIMIQSKKLRDKIVESTHQPPHENLLLVDLPGEIWKPFPVAPFDELYVISNKGRLKRLVRTVERKDGISTLLPERIVKQGIANRFNHYLKQTFYSLHFIVIALNGLKKTYVTGRIMYYTFVKPFDLSDTNLIVRHKDENGLNNNPDNLYLSERKHLGRWIVDNDRRSRLVGASDRNSWPQEELERWIGLQKKSVSQYDLEGRLIATYNSRLEAAEALGISSTQITAVIKERQQTSGNFLWLEGANNPKQIKVAELKLLNNPVKSKKVAQYSLSGDLLRMFPSIKEAAESIHISPTTLGDRIYGPGSPKDFIWKIVEDNQEPPVKIEVKPFVPVKVLRKDANQISDFTYPYQNHALEDMPGEQWRAIPHTGDTYFASSYGRIKAVDRVIERGNAQLWQLGRIIHQTVKKYKKNYVRGLIAHFEIDKKIFSYQVAHLVYRLFNGEIPHKYTIKYKDDDPLNCKAENLALEPLSNKYKQYHKEGRLSGSRFYKQVAQFTLDGKHIKTYPSLKDASSQTGFYNSGISECANGKIKQFKGFIWKYI